MQSGCFTVVTGMDTSASRVPIFFRFRIDATAAREYYKKIVRCIFFNTISKFMIPRSGSALNRAARSVAADQFCVMNNASQQEEKK
jgi:hypothetical protein